MPIMRVVFDLETLAIERNDGGPVDVSEVGRNIVDLFRDMKVGKVTFVQCDESFFKESDRKRLVDWLNDPSSPDTWRRDELVLAINAGLPWQNPRMSK